MKLLSGVLFLKIPLCPSALIPRQLLICDLGPGCNALEMEFGFRSDFSSVLALGPAESKKSGCPAGLSRPPSCVSIQDPLALFWEVVWFLQSQRLSGKAEYSHLTHSYMFSVTSGWFCKFMPDTRPAASSPVELAQGAAAAGLCAWAGNRCVFPVSPAVRQLVRTPAGLQAALGWHRAGTP